MAPGSVSAVTAAAAERRGQHRDRRRGVPLQRGERVTQIVFCSHLCPSSLMASIRGDISTRSAASALDA